MIFDLFTWPFMNIVFYLLGGFIEVIGIALVANKNLVTPGFMQQNHIWIGILFAIFGYIIAIAARGGN